VNLAENIIHTNGMEGRIKLINKMSTDVTVAELGGEPATILVSEIFGTLLLSESTLHYVEDARHRLLSKDAQILPRRGTQFVTLIQSPDIEAITSVRSWGGIDLRPFNALQDTTSLVFTKQYGFRFSRCVHQRLSEPIAALTVDFAKDSIRTAFPRERRVRFTATHTGRAHVGLATWEVYDDDGKSVMSTDPRATADNFARDMQWGQAMQLLEEAEPRNTKNPTPAHLTQPLPVMVTEGEELELVVRFSNNGVQMNMAVERVTQKNTTSSSSSSSSSPSPAASPASPATAAANSVAALNITAAATTTTSNKAKGAKKGKASKKSEAAV
jgi:protein arginine N-methyltransferase 7